MSMRGEVKAGRPELGRLPAPCPMWVVSYDRYEAVGFWHITRKDDASDTIVSTDGYEAMARGRVMFISRDGQLKSVRVDAIGAWRAGDAAHTMAAAGTQAVSGFRGLRLAVLLQTLRCIASAYAWRPVYTRPWRSVQWSTAYQYSSIALSVAPGRRTRLEVRKHT